MNKPAQILNTRVKTRCCPGCGFLIHQIQVERMQIVPPCPKCGEYTVDQFQIVEWEQKGGEGA